MGAVVTTSQAFLVVTTHQGDPDMASLLESFGGAPAIGFVQVQPYCDAETKTFLFHLCYTKSRRATAALRTWAAREGFGIMDPTDWAIMKRLQFAKAIRRFDCIESKSPLHRDARMLACMLAQPEKTRSAARAYLRQVESAPRTSDSSSALKGIIRRSRAEHRQSPDAVPVTVSFSPSMALEVHQIARNHGS